MYTGWEYHDRARDRLGKFENQGKTARINIRLTDQQRAAIQARANACMKDVTRYLLDLVQRDMMREEFRLEVPMVGQKEG